MTQQSDLQRRTAESLGWTDIYTNSNGHLLGWPPGSTKEDNFSLLSVLPDWPNDIAVVERDVWPKLERFTIDIFPGADLVYISKPGKDVVEGKTVTEASCLALEAWKK